MVAAMMDNKYSKLTALIFIFFTLWWIIIQFAFPPSSNFAKIFGGLYGVMAAFGGIWSLHISRKWGGLKSIIGRAVFLFGLGLLLQESGQLISSYYNYVLNMDPIPYPSLGDIGFFGCIPAYVMATYYLGKASGVHIGFRSFKNKIQAILIPSVLLIVGYTLFLKDYQFDWSNGLKIFLDFAYPLGDALYISFAILTLLLVRGVLGGIMKNRVLFILLALGVQFLADWTFLFQSAKGSWIVGGINDYFYFGAYFIMTLAILQFNAAFNQLNRT